MSFLVAVVQLITVVISADALRFDNRYVRYNLNTNEEATDPLDYSGIWGNHTFYPSPSNWRFPFYTLFVDKFANGDPSNDNINGTLFEHDPMQTQLRHGGDFQGLIDSLDYIRGMGIKGIYIAGSPMMNFPWGADGYSPLDFTLLDQHFGDIEMYRNMVTEVHNRGMYVIADNTVATMGDLNAFEGYTNSSAPFAIDEHVMVWRDPMRRYHDFAFSNKYNETCQYPRFWNNTGYPIDDDVVAQMKGCYDSEFDQYGDTEAFGVYPDWRRQLSKFASVQDRLREWVPSVREKIERFSCLQIKMLDIDGFRIDKATQITVDALGEFSHAMRLCAQEVGKHNFFMPGEITGGNTFGSVYLGRGRQPNMTVSTIVEAATMNGSEGNSHFIRDAGKNALDASAFHYSVYRSLARFLGMDGNLGSDYDTPVDWVVTWNNMLVTNDLINPSTGKFDPRHMYGVSNQDVFRWPAIKNGIDKQLLGFFITTLLMPGIPLVSWGEEQGFYVLDNTAINYVFGRQAMSAAISWQLHGCYTMTDEQYYGFDKMLDAAKHGCMDDLNSLDRRDPSHPIRNIMKSMYQMRENYPVLNDGILLENLSRQTRNIYLPGSGTTPTELGIWSISRKQLNGVQELSGTGQGNQSVWLIFQNDNGTITYRFNCSDARTALISPFDAGTTVKNLFYPYDEVTLISSSVNSTIEGSTQSSGCLTQLSLPPWGYKAYVPKDKFVSNEPMITKFLPGHDARLFSAVGANENESVQIQIHFSAPMNCDVLASTIEIISKTETNINAVLDKSTVTCADIPAGNTIPYSGSIPTLWSFTANLTNMYNGVHSVTIRNASTADGKSFTQSVDKFLLRIGQPNNPVIFPKDANYARGILHQHDNGSLYVSHKAAGADSWRYALDWAHFSDWMPYTGGNSTIGWRLWNGTKLQDWPGEHVILQYHNRLSGSSDYIQHGDLDQGAVTRRFPHLWAQGPFNQFGLNSGVSSQFVLESNGTWRFDFTSEWPTFLQINEWGINPDGIPDRTYLFGDIDRDGVLDRLPPSSLTPAYIQFSIPPPWPNLGWSVRVYDSTYRYTISPTGNQIYQIVIYTLMWSMPMLTALGSIWAFKVFFYSVKWNRIGAIDKRMVFKNRICRAVGKQIELSEDTPLINSEELPLGTDQRGAFTEKHPSTPKRILIATMEYNIEDWDIKIKIGGLGVMAELMGKHLCSQELIWVVPCVGGIEYPQDTPAESMFISILHNTYEVVVQYHKLRNITFVLLDAPVFRAQSKINPYPARMDDLDSAVYYSTWNQCIALAIQRFSVDIYHVNDYHGAAAPLYLLPERTVPICLSLHNAEFQGQWRLRNAEEFTEVSDIFNLKAEIVKKYIQFGDVFNLLHSGSSYLRMHQKGFGAVAVSKKYGARSYTRYPIFWGLRKVGQLPNPDPKDTASWSGEQETDDVVVDEEFEASRPELKLKAQEWAGLNQDPNADLLVFVGRWSMQKGIDLIADVMPAILEDNPKVQLICVGPVIDLYGKFAALKLNVMAGKYKGRVCSKPVFTQLPSFVHRGAEFALIPSRDEPFGLVAVEFGRQGALGIGARVGGLGQMPGWWFSIESTSTSHLLHQFKVAIGSALSSKPYQRRIMRARSSKQRFPVSHWLSQLEALHSNSIKVHKKVSEKYGLFENVDLNDGQESPTFLNLDISEKPSLNKNYSSKPISEKGVFSGSLAAETNGVSSFGYTDSDESRPSTPDAFYDDNSSSAGLRNASQLKNGFYDMVEHWHSLEINHGRTSDDYWSETPLESASEDEYNGEPSRILRNPYLQTPNGGNIHPDSGTPKKYLKNPLKRVRAMGRSRRGFSSQILNPRHSTLSVNSIVGDKTDFRLQNICPDFLDRRELFYKAFENSLGTLSGQNSETALCIEQYLVKSEREWHRRFKEAQFSHSSKKESKTKVSWSLEGHSPPTGIKRFMERKLGDWPIYSIALALGQIVAANSYTTTLLTGSVAQGVEKFYLITGIYLVGSILWWITFRYLKSVYVLSTPFLIYSMAFFLLGVAPYATALVSQTWIENIATGLYAAASSSGSLYVALNFADESGIPITTWIGRAFAIQGLQQVYVTTLWAWGNTILQNQVPTLSLTPPPLSHALTFTTLPVSAIFFVIYIVLYTGLPSTYRSPPFHIPTFYISLLRRKVVLTFILLIVLQNFFLFPYSGRTWTFLFSSPALSLPHTILLSAIFTLPLWPTAAYLIARFSAIHTWLLPLLAIGLISPRWAQILWSCTPLSAYLPWARSAILSSILSRLLWLWLSLLDVIQGIGIGLILAQTLTRMHVAAALVGAQVVGSAATILAKFLQVEGMGGFPDLTRGMGDGAIGAWFWAGLGAQVVGVLGLVWWFRREQLGKP